MDNILHSIARLYKRHNSFSLFSESYNYALNFLKDHPQPQLTQGEKHDIDDYWGTYNIHYKDYSWFQMYYGVTGIHDPRFIPNPIAGYILYPYYNDKSMISGWDDKNLYQELVPHVHFPSALCHCIRGRLYDSDWHYYAKDENNILKLSEKIFQELDNHEIIFKSTRSTAAGKGVKKLIIKSPYDIKDTIIQTNCDNYVIQKKVTQHPFFSQFNESSVNIIRIVSWQHNGEIKTFPASIRYGINGICTDVAFNDGKEILNVVGMTDEGKINNNFVNLDGKMSPSCNIDIVTCPAYNSMIESIIDAHSHIFPFEVIGWDFTIDNNNHPICIEYNIVWPGTIIYQYANGPFADKYTDDFLFPLKLRENKELIKLFHLS